MEYLSINYRTVWCSDQWPSPVVENIFEHHGIKGHEIVFAFPINFDDPNVYTKQRFQILEHQGTAHWVEWVDIDSFRNKKELLFPEAVVSHLTS